MTGITRIGLIGDLHGSWDDWDVRYFNASDYELLLFMGDLGSGTSDNGVRIARSIGRLAKPALIMPGNNDAHQVSKLAAEIGHQRGLSALRKVGALFGSQPGEETGQVHLCGYSLHNFTLAARTVTILAARPYAMGGGELSFPERLSSVFGITTVEDSVRKLRSLVDESMGEELIILAHNGPSGLGDAATDLWGADFRPEAGDWGDPDLADVIAYAEGRGKHVRAVLAGHMHSPTRQGPMRSWQLQVGKSLYVNSARVPRIWEDQNGKYRHHVVLELSASATTVREIIVHESP